MSPASSPALPPSIAQAVRDAGWLAHRYDPGHDAVHLLPVPRDLHGRVTFLTDDYLPKGLEPLVVSRADAIAAAPPPAPLHFVFHSAFCLSTLLARAFDLPGRAMALKEPVILNDIVGWRRRRGQGPDMAAVLDDTLRLLARPFSPGESVIVKPSNIASVLIAPILTLRPDAHALLLHAPLRTYLGSVARKGLDGRLWVRTLLLGLLDDGLVDFGFSPRDHLGHTDLQAAAIGWLAQHALFAQLTARFPGRVRTLDSATLTATPDAAIDALGTLFGLPFSEAERAAILAGPAFTSHSKSGATFTAGDRAQEESEGLARHADEIDKVIVWTDAVARSANIALTLPAPLI